MWREDHMTHSQFIGLLCVYGITYILSEIAEKCVSLPQHVIAAKPNLIKNLKLKSKFYLACFLLVTVVVAACGIIGFVGMLFFWPTAPWIFGCGVVGKILLSRIVSAVIIQGGVKHMFNEIELLLNGVILTLIFFGPAKQLFFAN